jgi:membrane protein
MGKDAALSDFENWVAQVGRRLWRAAVGAYNDNAFGIAKGAAYSALLAFFPVLATVAAILVQVNAAAVSRSISNFLFEVVPPGTEELVVKNLLVVGARPASLLVSATLLSAWAASGVMMSMMEGFHAAYRIPDTRSFLKKRGTAVLLVFLAVLPAVGASALMLAGQRAERSLLRWLGVLGLSQELHGWLAFLGFVVRYSIAFATVVLVTACLYSLGIQKHRPLRRVWPGATVATVLWLAATLVFSWYVRNIANYNVMYGSVGAVIALLVWMYVLAVVALIGCEYNAEEERQG